MNGENVGDDERKDNDKNTAKNNAAKPPPESEDYPATAPSDDRLIDKIRNMPDENQEKINALREKIRKGEYNPSSRDIADAILEREKKKRD